MIYLLCYNWVIFFHRILKARELTICARKFRRLLGKEITENLKELVHHLLHPVPPDKIQLILIDYIFLMVQLLCDLSSPVLLKCCPWGASNFHSVYFHPQAFEWKFT